jgi:hypothetical protein
VVSVRSTIYDAFVTALATITVANGYNSTLASAQKVQYIADDSARPYVILSFKQDDKSDISQETTMGTIRWSIFAYIDEVNEGDAASIEDEVDLLVADIEKLVAAKRVETPPLSTTGTRDIILEGHKKYDVAGEWVQGATVFGRIEYHHDAADPDAP